MVSKLLEKCKKPNLTSQKSAVIMDQVNTILQSIKTDLDFINTQKKSKKPSKKTPSVKSHTTTISKPTKDQLDRDLDEVKLAHEREHEYIITKLESLQKEAKLLGIDNKVLRYRPAGYRRGSRSWGHNSLRGRNSLTWSRTTAGSSMDSESTLTSSFKISGLPEEQPFSLQSISDHFAQFGRVKNIGHVGNDILVQMESRNEAEHAMEKGYSINGVTMTLAWFNETQDPTESQRNEDENHTEEPVVEEFFRKDGPAGSDSENDDYK